jgi:hypothetical protein
MGVHGWHPRQQSDQSVFCLVCRTACISVLSCLSYCLYHTHRSFEAAEADCTAVLAFPGLSAPDQVKALLRRGTARIHKNELAGATADFKQVLVLEPNNRQAREELRVSVMGVECRKGPKAGVVFEWD